MGEGSLSCTVQHRGQMHALHCLASLFSHGDEECDCLGWVVHPLLSSLFVSRKLKRL